ncbi:MAG TPA: type I DNA topoisomerase [Vicinamibacterales bacterium]
MAKPLVIVESPAKAKTLSRFLGNKYRVEASFGHVRDLPEKASEVPKEIKDRPWGRMAVDVEGEFTPYYVIPADKKKHIQALKAALKDASELLLATDPDREGESISAHLKEVLRPKVPTRRIVFHEITEEAVREALEHARDVDAHLVKAQEGRRILDRLYGYTLSPVLWKKVQTGLSAGRVQSVAVRLIVEREEERRAFRKATFWDLEARLAGGGREFTATLVRIGDQRLATGKDFDPTTGTLRESGVRLLNEADARALAADLSGHLPWTVTAVEERPTTQRPSAPFTTSTLQQEANRKLGFSADRTMRAAQGLHDAGLISYHRTDSTTLSQKALGEAARAVREIYGEEFYGGPRQYQTRVRNAQEAHEAIRPTDFSRRPQDLQGVDPDEARIYELIWKRAIASQMADARLIRTTIEITATASDGRPCVFTASGKAIEFAGFLRAYVEGRDDPGAALDDQETILPAVRQGDRVVASDAAGADRSAVALVAVEPKGHETTPPPRYTDASLVKRLEDEGIGRPSTYASIISTILRRGYVFRQGKALVPSFTAFAVTELLRKHFADYIDLGFTAEMEEDLDEVASGDRTSLDFVREFYRGTKDRPGLEQRVQDDDEISYPAVDLGVDPETGQPLKVRIGRYGPFVQRGEGGPGNTASLPDEIAPADFTVEQALELLKAKAEGPRLLGSDPATGLPVYLMSGRFGAYVQLGETPEKGKKAPKPKRASLPSTLTEATVTLDDALRLLNLPREVGRHPDDGQPIVANFGRFGPYIKHNDEFRSLENESDVFDITLERAVELLREPKRSRRQKAARTVLNQLGTRPDGGAPVQVLAGRYGPYVTDGKTNASLPKGTDPAKLTMEEALALLKAREEAGTAKRPVRKATPRKRVAKAS